MSQGVDLGSVQVMSELASQVAFLKIDVVALLGNEFLVKKYQILAEFTRDLFPGKIPEYGAQFVIHMEANTVVDQPQVAVGTQQDMATFTVGVIDQQIE